MPPFAYFGLLMTCVGLSFMPVFIGKWGVYVLVLGIVTQFFRTPVRIYAVKRIRHVVSDFSSIQWLGLVVPFMIAGLFYIPTSQGVAMLDWFHPTYELSIGRSFSEGVLHVFDKSYAGKVLKFHFLGSQMPFLFTHSLSGNVLMSAGGYLIAFYLCFYIILTYFLNKRLSVSCPFWVMYFFPLIGIKSIMMPPTPSVMLGGVLALIFILFILDKRRSWALVTLGCVLLAKASFFLVLIGGVWLWDGFRKRWLQYGLWYGGVAIVFVVLYLLFFKGAHGHIMWVHFPSTIKHYLFHGNGSLPLFYLPLMGVFIWRFFVEKEDNRRLLAAIGLSGFLGITLVMEVTSGDHLQFLKAVGPAGVMTVWWTVRRLTFPSTFTRVLRYRLMILSLGVLVFALPYFRHVTQHILSPTVGMSQDAFDAYSWLSSAPKGTVVFGPYYQVSEKIFGNTSINGHWFMRSGYERSALSDQTFWVESVKWKGVSTMPDISQRVAQLVQFYIGNVDFSEVSKQRVGLLFSDAFGEQAVVPHQRSDNFGKEWSWLNLQHKIAFETKEALMQKGSMSEAESKVFLHENSIKYIVLEDGDRPALSLYELARVVFKNDTYTILEVM